MDRQFQQVNICGMIAALVLMLLAAATGSSVTLVLDSLLFAVFFYCWRAGREKLYLTERMQEETERIIAEAKAQSEEAHRRAVEQRHRADEESGSAEGTT